MYLKMSGCRFNFTTEHVYKSEPENLYNIFDGSIKKIRILIYTIFRTTIKKYIHNWIVTKI